MNYGGFRRAAASAWRWPRPSVCPRFSGSASARRERARQSRDPRARGHDRIPGRAPRAPARSWDVDRIDRRARGRARPSSTRISRCLAFTTSLGPGRLRHDHGARPCPYGRSLPRAGLSYTVAGTRRAQGHSLANRASASVTPRARPAMRSAPASARSCSSTSRAASHGVVGRAATPVAIPRGRAPASGGRLSA